MHQNEPKKHQCEKCEALEKYVENGSIEAAKIGVTPVLDISDESLSISFEPVARSLVSTEIGHMIVEEYNHDEMQQLGIKNDRDLMRALKGDSGQRGTSAGYSKRFADNYADIFGKNSN